MPLVGEECVCGRSREGQHPAVGTDVGETLTVRGEQCRLVVDSKGKPQSACGGQQRPPGCSPLRQERCLMCGPLPSAAT